MDFNGGELYAELAPYTEPPPLPELSLAVMLEPCLSIGRGGSGTARSQRDTVQLKLCIIASKCNCSSASFLANVAVFMHHF